MTGKSSSDTPRKTLTLERFVPLILIPIEIFFLALSYLIMSICWIGRGYIFRFQRTKLVNIYYFRGWNKTWSVVICTKTNTSSTCYDSHAEYYREPMRTTKCLEIRGLLKSLQIAQCWIGNNDTLPLRDNHGGYRFTNRHRSFVNRYANIYLGANKSGENTAYMYHNYEGYTEIELNKELLGESIPKIQDALDFVRKRKLT